MRYLRIGLSVLAVLLLVVLYNWRSYRGFGTQEAMDSAQLARNIAEGNGFRTQFIRPLSLYVLKKYNQQKLGPSAPGKLRDDGELKTAHPELINQPELKTAHPISHPDLINPPLYPAVLASLMKVGSWFENVPFLRVLSFRFPVDTTHVFWSHAGLFLRYQPEFLITMFNQCLFFLVIASVFFLARRLFEARVAWLAAILVLGTNLLWRFSISGLSTMLLLLIFMGLAWCIVLLEEETREPRWHPVGVFILSIGAGLLVGLGGLTRYSFGLLVLPVLGFVLLTTGRQRWALGLATLLAFTVVFAPWTIRNYTVCGNAFGIAGYSLLETSPAFAEHRLERSLEPDLKLSFMAKMNVARLKLMANSRNMVQEDLPRLGGSWVSAFFVVGLLAPFKNPAIRRLRYFLVGSLAVLAVTQAMGRTQLSEDSPEINAENLLVLVGPLVAMYGVSYFYFLFDQIYFPFRELRYGALGLFAAVACLPLILTFLPPKAFPVVFPPYYPPSIQQMAGWTGQTELLMSDVPWAVAWYGDRQCLWLTLDTKDDFFQVHDYQKPIALAYLTSVTMDSRLSLELGEQTWGRFILNGVVNNKIPDTFPLRRMRGMQPPPQVVLADWDRWRRSGDQAVPNQ
jgi:4-amino-4-deoxy-L-arabinose transferase-like glycosyltransferase